MCRSASRPTPGSPSTPPRSHRRLCVSRFPCSAGRNKSTRQGAVSGGGFGGKLYINLQAGGLARTRARPVKISLTMEEQFYTLNKHASYVPHQSRASRTTASTAPQCEVGERRAYADIARHYAKIRFTAPGPTTSTTSRSDSYSLYTNRRPAGPAALRHPAARLAYESHTDMMGGARSSSTRSSFAQKPPERRPPAGPTLMKDAAIAAVLDRSRCA